MAYLKHTINGEAAALYELAAQADVIIGRHSDCNIVINDPTVSGHHASVKKQGSAFYLRDLGSTNGVRLGKQAITEHQLKEGDVFVLGVHQFEFITSMPTELDQTLRIKKSWIPGIYYTE